MHDKLGGDRAARARSVIDDKRLPQPARQPLAEQACASVGGSAGRKANDNAQRACWIGLRPSDARYGRQRGSACGQMQKISAGKFHFRTSLNIIRSPKGASLPNANDEGPLVPQKLLPIRLFGLMI